MLILWIHLAFFRVIFLFDIRDENLSTENSTHVLLLRLLPSSTLFQLMAIHAHKNGDESSDRLQQRFKKQVQKSGILKLLRERSNRRKTLTRRLQRIRALKREEYRTQNRKKQFYSNM